MVDQREGVDSRDRSSGSCSLSLRERVTVCRVFVGLQGSVCFAFEPPSSPSFFCIFQGCFGFEENRATDPAGEHRLLGECLYNEPALATLLSNSLARAHTCRMWEFP